MGQVTKGLVAAYEKENSKTGFTQAQLANKIGVDKSVVTRRLHGDANMTLRTLADMIWALDHEIEVKIFQPNIVRSINRPQEAKVSLNSEVLTSSSNSVTTASGDGARSVYSTPSNSVTLTP